MSARCSCPSPSGLGCPLALRTGGLPFPSPLDLPLSAAWTLALVLGLEGGLFCPKSLQMSPRWAQPLAPHPAPLLRAGTSPSLACTVSSSPSVPRRLSSVSEQPQPLPFPTQPVPCTPTLATVHGPPALGQPPWWAQGSQGRLPRRGSPFLKDGRQIVGEGALAERACGAKEQNSLPLHLSLCQARGHPSLCF